jgi:hypothetical protein
MGAGGSSYLQITTRPSPAGWIESPLTARTQKLRLPLALALSGLTFTVVALAGAHFLIRSMLRSAVERDLTLAAQQLAGKLDQGMFERWQDITLGARRQVLRDRAGDSPEREIVEEIRARHVRYAWVGFTDENCIVRVSTEKSLDGMSVEMRPWCVRLARARSWAISTMPSSSRAGPGGPEFDGEIEEPVVPLARIPARATRGVAQEGKG